MNLRLLFYPVAVFLWFIGWSLSWVGSKRRVEGEGENSKSQVMEVVSC